MQELDNAYPPRRVSEEAVRECFADGRLSDRARVAEVPQKRKNRKATASVVCLRVVFLRWLMVIVPLKY